MLIASCLSSLVFDRVNSCGGCIPNFKFSLGGLSRVPTNLHSQIYLKEGTFQRVPCLQDNILASPLGGGPGADIWGGGGITETGMGTPLESKAFAAALGALCLFLLIRLLAVL
jgi:hypothetical protein